ncbi:hypothetical protein [Lactobacillus xylocopicola]|uniref:Uncharacterized protein n=1 Tax=Lactobacillus xylocopicola TaxID=2976676 RepID=A0ABN6SLA2_9LACO|nr:hypothetical protein [Lactobacillus xylocopicola]BDR61100.1 hypothetical protein KIM322_13610 [Lactobacillus xylocopicola]
MKTNSNNWNLPAGDKYRNWSKQLLRQQVGHDQVLDQYLTGGQNYCINAKTLAVYEFQQQPLLGKYKSVAFDSQEGIVLSQRSSSALLTAYGKQCLLAGIEFQREFARQINIKGRNTIATGRLAYFSMRSYNAGNVDWVALHQMASFKVVKQYTINFVSIGPGGCVFTFNNCTNRIHDRLRTGLLYNHYLCKLGLAHLEERLGWKVKPPSGPSLLDQSDYFHPHQSSSDLSLNAILQDLLNKKHSRYAQYLADYYEQAYLTESHRVIYHLSQRPDTLY